MIESWKVLTAELDMLEFVERQSYAEKMSLVAQLVRASGC